LREGRLTDPSEIKPRNECEDAIQSEKLAADKRSILAVNIISQKQEFNVLLLKAAKTKYIQIHIYAFRVMKFLSTRLKAGYTLKHEQVDQGFSEYVCMYVYIYICKDENWFYLFIY